ncbi:hypothetical protein [Methanobrevibacter sp.]|uniref:hypothetical protein n=1 Tax=Methanobrevibacter sp. TaxID=66852 RepID=UPI00388E82A1
MNNSFNMERISAMRKLNYRDLIIFLIPLFIFGYYLYALNPGIMNWDTYFQFHQIATNKFTNWHPFFHTFILMTCVETIGAAISYPILQILTFSTMWTVICKYCRDDSSKSNRTFYLQCIVTLIVCSIPLNPLFSLYFYKDTLFSYFLMFLCFLIKVILDKKGRISFTFILVLAVTLSFVSQLRYNGTFIVLIILILLSAYFFKNNKKRNYHILIPAMTVMFILLICSLNVIYDVEDNQKDAIMSKTGHMLADYDLNLKLDENDKGMLGELFNESRLDQHYHVTCSDLIYTHNMHKDVFKSNEKAYVFMAMKYSLKHPKHFIKYLFESSPMVWKIVKEDDWLRYQGMPSVYPYNTRYYSSMDQIPSTDYDNLTFNNMESREYKNIKSLVDYVNSNELVYTLFNSPALYMYLSLIILGAVYLMTKSKDLFLVYLPNMINIIIVFFSTPAPQLRYLYPNFLVFYLLIIMVIEILEKVKRDSSR